ncbi:DUF2207 family protein [Cellulomonas pakistanensis]|uniref:Predicted membrane protein YciQ-like C-terminal domain-containing protein n=1 Tax=Cellulomonas pakistanensis TaxID=992287 RepID=A0A919PBQ7_9CELL|nr:DUF2207 domain-containing protein [Cellulomonas pakistanensis]GIG38099.1 hypothetical protein Cpa01nite_34800 [Cellulomonas pakistanensis]
MEPSPDLLGPALGVLALGFAIEMLRIFREQPPTDPPRPTWPPRRTEPLPGVAVLVGAHVARWRRRSATAQLAELVRRGALRLDPADPARVEVVDPSALDPVEHAFVAALVRAEPRVGSRAQLRAGDVELAGRVREVQAAVNALVLDLGLRYRPAPRPERVPLRLALVALTVVAAVLAVQDPRAWFVALTLGFAALLDRRRERVRPLTAEGAALRDHLRGIKDWLRFADLDEPADLGPLLPWAVVFGELGPWRARGGDEGPDLRALLVALGGDRPEQGTDDEQPGDAWADQATGGSRAEHDGAYVPPSD